MRMAVTLWHADDIAILISRKLPNTISELLQEALNMVQLWCDRIQLSTNPQNMVTVPFTRKRDLRGLEEPTLCGHTLQLTYQGKIPLTPFWTRDLEGRVEK